MINLFIFALSFLSLPEKNIFPEQTTIKGKVIYKTCASLVVQITDSAYYNLGQEKWRRTAIDNEYEHVFLVKNRCAFLESKIQKDEEFCFVIIKENKDGGAKNDCPQCMLYDYPPDVALSIEPIKRKERD